MSKKYHAPATPCDRLLGSAHVSDAVKRQLEEQFARLDPVCLLCDIRSYQEALRGLGTRGPRDLPSVTAPSDIATFLDSLSTAWKAGGSSYAPKAGELGALVEDQRRPVRTRVARRRRLAAYFSPSRTPISNDPGQRFRGSRTPFQADRGQRFSVMADS